MASMDEAAPATAPQGPTLSRSAKRKQRRKLAKKAWWLQRVGASDALQPADDAAAQAGAPDKKGTDFDELFDDWDDVTEDVVAEPPVGGGAAASDVFDELCEQEPEEVASEQLHDAARGARGAP